jgi:hypothetical protein
MKGFDHDDHIQQVLALLVVVAVLISATSFTPTGKLTTILLWGIGSVAVMWYLFIAKGIACPFAWVDGLRAIANLLLRRGR